MRVFLDFEASSLSRQSYPIEIGWVFEDGRSGTCLIKPAETWTEWDPAAEAIHHISRDMLERDGVPYDIVARKTVDALTGHALLASAPSWDGKWMSRLLRAAGFPRHSLRLGDSDTDALACARAILDPVVPAAQIDTVLQHLLAGVREPAGGQPPAHRALPDALEERRRHRALTCAAEALAVAYRQGC
ncbi:MAG: transcriptional regulator [Sphingomonas sp.]|uniref:3'-5' exonuclease n=1 Tax=Sphingomonas sp. TaxID=28214 RepID=UPI003568BE02